MPVYVTYLVPSSDTETLLLPIRSDPPWLAKMSAESCGEDAEQEYLRIKSENASRQPSITRNHHDND